MGQLRPFPTGDVDAVNAAHNFSFDEGAHVVRTQRLPPPVLIFRSRGVFPHLEKAAVSPVPPRVTDADRLALHETLLQGRKAAL